jgi:hypothetical protein
MVNTVHISIAVVLTHQQDGRPQSTPAGHLIDTRSTSAGHLMDI